MFAFGIDDHRRIRHVSVGLAGRIEVVALPDPPDILCFFVPLLRALLPQPFLCFGAQVLLSEHDSGVAWCQSWFQVQVLLTQTCIKEINRRSCNHKAHGHGMAPCWYDRWRRLASRRADCHAAWRWIPQRRRYSRGRRTEAELLSWVSPGRTFSFYACRTAGSRGDSRPQRYGFRIFPGVLGESRFTGFFHLTDPHHSCPSQLSNTSIGSQ
ncbi:MAG: Uncharacterised protein [Synechococcus sp. MIT S9220]|nr:MAG: Uncharacterised protein [Synechococcus sp. MIT S9220]